MRGEDKIGPKCEACGDLIKEDWRGLRLSHGERARHCQECWVELRLGIVPKLSMTTGSFGGNFFGPRFREGEEMGGYQKIAFQQGEG